MKKLGNSISFSCSTCTDKNENCCFMLRKLVIQPPNTSQASMSSQASLEKRKNEKEELSNYISRQFAAKETSKFRSKQSLLTIRAKNPAKKTAKRYNAPKINEKP